MLLQIYGEVGSGCVPMTEWNPGDVKAHIDFQHALNAELLERGELVDAQGLAGPDQARFVVADGGGAPVVTDGPFLESKEFLAGYRMVDVETLQRAVEIAAQASAAPRAERRAGPSGHRGAPGAERSRSRSVSVATPIEGLQRELAPQVLGAVVRRYGDFADAEDAVQDALLAASTAWATDGLPDRPLAWLIRVSSRRLADQYRSDDARRRREELAASMSLARPDAPPGHDDTLILMFLCCSPALSPMSAIPLTLRAVGGLSTREIAAAFLVPETTMAQRISRAKAKVRAPADQFVLPSSEIRAERLRSVQHVLYLLFNEGYASSSDPDLAGPIFRAKPFA